MLPGERKKKPAPLLNAIEALCAQASQGADPRNAARITEHVLAQLVCMGTHTVTGLINARGRQFEDWSADYRLYSHSRAVPAQLFAPVLRWLCARQDGPIVMAMDDTLLRKTGKKTHGVKYMRDPLGPPFRVNLVRAQRFVQISAACPGKDGQARMIPVDWTHAPLPQKPKAKASQAQWEQYHETKKQSCCSAAGARRIRHIRAWLDENGASGRPLWMSVDGAYTNGTVLKALPHDTTLVGRIRADAKLYFLPDQQHQKGRPRSYGESAPTPEQVRKDPKIPWKKVRVYFGGKKRSVRVKQITPLRWRAAGEEHVLQLLAVAPTPYRLTKNAKCLYRKPAYLICTDPNAPVARVLQYYLWRWDIEVNFRDEKTILGVGDAQVRTPGAVQNLTGCAVAAYAILLAAAEQCQDSNNKCLHLPPPKWQPQKTQRPTTNNLIRNLRYELWADAIHFSGFAIKNPPNKKKEKRKPTLDSALFYASQFS